MKLLPEHVAYIKTAICADSHAPTWLDYKARGLSAKRWRWDFIYRAKLSQWICDNVYKYANDEHIDTALRHILGDEQ